MRPKLGRTCTPILLCLSTLLLIILTSLPLLASSGVAQASTDSPPVALDKGWQYCWDDSPITEDNIPLWTREDIPTVDWQSLEINKRIQKPGEDIKVVWLRIKLPEGKWKSPTLYQKISFPVEIYLEDKLITKLATQEDSVDFTLETEDLKFIPLNADIADKTLFLRVYTSYSDFFILKPRQLVLGSQVAVVNILFREQIENIVNLTLGVFYIVLGIISLFLLFKAQEKPHYFSFSLLAIAAGLSTFATSGEVGWLLTQPDQQFLSEISENLGEISLLLLPGFIYIFFERNVEEYRSFIRRKWQVYLLLITFILSLEFSLFPLAEHWLVASILRFVIRLSVALMLANLIILSACCTVILFSKSYSREKKIFALGFLILTSSLLIETSSILLSIDNLGFFKSSNIFPFGMLIFILILGWVFQRRFTQARRSLKAYAKELEEKNSALQHMDKLKDDFLANTSHELRTPLNGIIGLAESLIDGATGKLSQPTLFNISLIVSSARRLNQLVNDILDFSKLKYDNISLNIKPVGIREVTEVVLLISKPLINKKSLQLINSIQPEIPPVDADENRVQQILYNLIGNAIKFTESGTVEVSATMIGNFLEITVSDAGIGISDDNLEGIFELFEQADTSISRKYGGTGLGLAVTKQLVQLHGGEIRVKSQKGKGSQFTFTLPVSQEQLATASPPLPNWSMVSQLLGISNSQGEEENFSNCATQSLSDCEVINLKKLGFKILIVDDEPVNLQVLVNHLSLQSYSITQASNGQEALKVIEEGFRPDLILLDVMMPNMTGYEVCQKIREKFRASELPVVLLTAKNQVNDLVEGFVAGANDYLTKPISKYELLARIKTHIRLSKINVAYRRFVPHEFLEFLDRESIVEVQLGDSVQKEMTIMFSDIRSFTSLSEKMSPQENFDFINEYLKKVSPVIRKNQGFIDKYIGDAIMALFPKTADDALQAAIEIQRQVSIYNSERQAISKPPIAIGIGLHTGSLMLGTIGDEQRMESTVIADAVNLASRFEGLTKVYGAAILISGETLSRLSTPEKYAHRFLGKVKVKGKKI
ncbi:MAG: ATP-binding protein, partial [Coleofasciculaceae cyanobacterium]